jgi:pyridoxal phosphate enzyme (YggS family)
VNDEHDERHDRENDEALIGERLAEVQERIATAARTSGRDPAAVSLVVVTKEVDVQRIRAARAAGAVDLGENRTAELVAKAEAIGSTGDPDRAPRWHFIGRLQRNKVRAAAPYVALWQSIDREELAAEVGRRAPGAEVLVQVNVTGEAQKGGCPPAEAPALVDACRAHGCRVDGLMTVPPLAGDPRPVFARVRQMTDDLGLRVCSMGMSGDYEVAIAEGATMVRVGSAIFGPRPGVANARR